MINNLKACSPVMYRAFTLFKERQTLGVAITQEDIEIASGKRVLDAGQANWYFRNLESASQNLRLAFEKQAKDAAVQLCLSFHWSFHHSNTGSMGSREVRTTCFRMARCLRSAVWGSWPSWVSRHVDICTPSSSQSQNPSPRRYQTKGNEDGGRCCWINEGDVRRKLNSL